MTAITANWIDATPAEAVAVADAQEAARAAKLTVQCIGTPAEVMSSVFAYYGVKPTGPRQRPAYELTREEIAACKGDKVAQLQAALAKWTRS